MMGWAGRGEERGKANEENPWRDENNSEEGRALRSE